MFDDDKPTPTNDAPSTPQGGNVRMRQRPHPRPPSAMPAVADTPPRPQLPSGEAEPMPPEASIAAPAQLGSAGMPSTDEAPKAAPRRRGRAKRPKKQPTGDYESGYCRTPVPTRFKKGKSGNPRGPRKREVTIQSAFRKLLAETTTVTRDGKRMVMSKAEILAHQLWQRAMQGQASAINAALKFAPELKETILDAANTSSANLAGDAEAGISATDRETMRWFLDGYSEDVNEELLNELEAEFTQDGDGRDEP